MQYKTDAFIKIFQLELEDLKCDIQLLIEKYTQDHDKDKITNYVFKENVALMHNEIFGIDGLYKQAKLFDPLQFKSIDDVVKAIDDWLEMLCKQNNQVKSINILVKRKIEKIRRYIEGNY